jgi:hypothetical protein
MIEYLVSKRHPVQLGTKADPFPRGIEPKVRNTRRFLELCNQVNYPVYISTKNTENLPVDLLADGNYVLGVSLASHRARDIKLLERNTSGPQVRLERIPRGAFKKVIVRWQPFIPELYKSKNGKQLFDLSEIDDFLDMISEVEIVGSDDLNDLDVVELFTYIREQAHLRGLEFYTANYMALSDSPVCCGLRDGEFEIATKWVWAYLIRKLFDGEKEYLTVEDLRQAFPGDLKDVIFDTMDVPLFSRWAHYSARKTTILEEYIKDFTYNRRMNPANYFAGLYSRVVNGELRIYFVDYRKLV